MIHLLKARPLRLFRSTRSQLFCFLMFSVLLVVQVLANIRDVNDAWILDGVLLPFVLLSFAYSATVSFSKSLKLAVIVTSIYLVIINLIPNLKYVFIYGYHDPLSHYGSIQETATLGYVSEVGAYVEQYGSTPGMHILVSILSIVAGLNTSAAMKAFLTVSPLVFPMAVYLVLRKLDIDVVLKKAIIACTVVTSPITYEYFGASAIYPIYALFIYMCLLSVLGRGQSRLKTVVAIFAGAAILISHDVTSFFLLTYMTILVLLRRSGDRIGSFFAPVQRNLLLFAVFTVMAIAHFTLSSSFVNFLRFFSLIEELVGRLLLAKQPVAFTYYEGFYHLSPFDQISILIVRYAKESISLLLLVLAPFAILKIRHGTSELRKLWRSLTLPLAIAVSMFFSLLFIRPTVHREFYMSSFMPFIVGVSVFYFFYQSPKRLKNMTFAIGLFGLILASSLTIYPCQPLIPTISTTEGVYYVLDTRQVNTAYDRSLIAFASIHSSIMSVWVDEIMKSQALALAKPGFHSLLTGNRAKSPLLLLSHTDSSHAIPSGRAASANEQYLQYSLGNSSILYVNGASYTVLNASNITPSTQGVLP